MTSGGDTRLLDINARLSDRTTATSDDPDHDILTGTDAGRPEKALVGRIMADGHPLHKVRIGTQV